jgi:hypothetical protein
MFRFFSSLLKEIFSQPKIGDYRIVERIVKDSRIFKNEMIKVYQVQQYSDCYGKNNKWISVHMSEGFYTLQEAVDDIKKLKRMDDFTEKMFKS